MLRNLIKQIRKKPYAVRQRYAVLISAILVAVVLGGWWGVRLGVDRAKRGAPDGGVLTERPFDGVRQIWQQFWSHLENATAAIDETIRFHDLDNDAADSSPLTPEEAAQQFGIKPEDRPNE